MIRSVVFDFGNVICAFDNDLFLRKLLPHTDMSLEDMREGIFGSDLHRRYESGLVSSDGFLREAARKCRLSISGDEFFDAYTGIFTPIPATIGLIRNLKGRYRIGLLSNTNEWHYERYIRNVEIFNLFDSVTLSFDVKEMKPSEGIYRDALAKLGVPPGECVYIDDIEAYAEGARRVGMNGIRYVSHDSLLQSLRAVGVTT
ncbi:MAG: HAD family phosphatase [Deltaproteobacteria bacterium]|nr:HAD family phosphatase [Deltaproteobacteria bacterium]